MKRKLSVLFVLSLSASLLFSACQKEKAETAKDAPLSVTETPAPSETLSDGETPADVLNDTGETSASQEEIQSAGEGGNQAVPGTLVTPGENSASIELGKSLTIQQDGNDVYRLTIDKMEPTDQRNEYEDSTDQVLAVTFTYENLSLDQGLLIDDTSFHLADQDNKACEPYYLSDESLQSLPAAKGASHTATVAFKLPGSAEKATLYYTEGQLGNQAEYVLSPGN